MTKDEKEKILGMRKGGAGYKTISKATGIPVTSVSSFCKRIEVRAGDRCLQCGAELKHIPHRKKKKFCSDECRMLWWHSHPNEINKQAYYTKICQYCGKEFISYGNDHRKFCSRECYGLSRRNK